MDYLEFQFIHEDSWTVQVRWQYPHHSGISNLQIAVKTTDEVDVRYEHVTPWIGYKTFKNLSEKKYTLFYKYNRNGWPITGKKLFFTQYSKEELQMLHDKALSYKQGSHMKRITHFYRNKPRQYYEYIQGTIDQIEKAQLKDWNGDISSPINKQLKGLFFNGVLVHGQPESNSPFGPTRLNVPVDVLFNYSTNLYFTDFYCTADMHYVTLVIAKQQTKEDEFCQRNLLSLNKHKNHWLNIIPGYRQLFLNHSRNLRVEIFYAHDVDTNFGTFDYNITTRGLGRSSRNGKRKNHRCSICNLARPKENFYADQVGAQQNFHSFTRESTNWAENFHGFSAEVARLETSHGFAGERTYPRGTFHAFSNERPQHREMFREVNNDVNRQVIHPANREGDGFVFVMLVFVVIAFCIWLSKHI